MVRTQEIGIRMVLGARPIDVPKPVSFEAVPKFLERDLAFGESLRLAVWDLALLALFNLVFFAAAWISFTNYDVR